MKTFKKIVAGAALLGAFTSAQAESMTFGVEIPPIASLVVRDGMILDVASMTYSTAVNELADPLLATGSSVVGGFTVITNMPKWNIYFGFANGGALKNQSGQIIKDKLGNPVYIGSVGASVADGTGEAAVYISTADAVNIKDEGTLIPGTTTAKTFGRAAADDALKINNTSNNTLVKALLDGNYCTVGAAPCVYTNPWVIATDLTTSNFDVTTGLFDAQGIGSVAGTYTETMYVTLVTAY